MSNFTKICLIVSALSLTACGGHQLRVKANADGTSSIVCTDGSSYTIQSTNNGQGDTSQKDCAGGYYGEQCEKQCPLNNNIYCYGYGSCHDGKQGTGCVCNVDWLNADCSFIKPAFGSLVDDRSGASVTYKTIKIGGKLWMAENLRYANGTKGTDYFSADGKAENDEQYGYLYTWDAATDACPSGWRLPSKDDFEELLDIVYLARTSTSETQALMAQSPDWANYIEEEGGDDFSFGALPAGYYYGGNYYSFGYYARFWSATEYEYHSINAYILYLGNGDANVGISYKDSASSVRCLKDSP